MARYGYDLRDHLPALFSMDEDVDGPDLQARQDYRELQGDLFRENFLTPIHEWCRRNNVLATGHLDIDHLTDGCLQHGYGTVLEQLRMLDVPGVDVIWRQIDIPRDGRPACAEGNGFFERFASSAAAQTGGKLALSESFGVYGASMTGGLARFTINHQLVRGINLFNFMDMSYSARIGLPFVERPEYMEELPGFRHLRAMNDYTARASYLMQLGVPDARCALLFPARDIWAGGKRRSQVVAAFDALGQALEARQVDFDIIDEDGLRACVREGNALKLGLAVYESLLIPDGATIPGDLSEKIRGIRREATPALACDTACLRVRKRLLPDESSLYMLFNESGESVCARVRFPETGIRVLLDAECAGAYRDEGETLSFSPGEAKFYLFPRGGAGFAQEPRRTLRRRYVIDRFTVRKTRETVIDETGLSELAFDGDMMPAAPGDWTPLFGKAFSGEAIYRATVRLDEMPLPGERYVLRLGRVEVSARVTICGHEAGIVWVDPMELTLDGAIFDSRREIELEIEVANTACNRMRAVEMDKLFDPRVIGPYMPRLKEFEAQFPAGGLYGPVVLDKME